MTGARGPETSDDAIIIDAPPAPTDDRLRAVRIALDIVDSVQRRALMIEPDRPIWRRIALSYHGERWQRVDPSRTSAMIRALAEEMPGVEVVVQRKPLLEWPWELELTPVTGPRMLVRGHVDD